MHLAPDAAQSGRRASLLVLSCVPLRVGHSQTGLEREDNSRGCVCVRVQECGRGFRKLEIRARTLYVLHLGQNILL